MSLLINRISTNTLSTIFGRRSPPVDPNIVNAGCLFFDGTNQYGSSPFDPSTIGTGDFSVEVWFNPYFAVSGVTNQIFLLGDETDNSLGLQFLGTDNSIRLYYRKSGSGTTISLTTGSLQTWSQAILTRTGTTIKCYINGIEVYSDSSAAFDCDLDSGCFIGSVNATPDSTFHGSLDNFRIWDSLLTASEVTALYNSGAPVTVIEDHGDYESSANVQQSNRFEELSGSTVADESGNSNTITLVNSPTWHQGCPNISLPEYASTHAIELDGSTDFLLPNINLLTAIASADTTIYVRAYFDLMAGASQHAFTFGHASSGRNYIRIYGNASSKIEGTFRATDGTTLTVADATSITEDQYYDLVITRDTSANQIELWIDGVSQGTSTASLTGADISDISRIGSWVNNGFLLDGRIRELAIWDEVLTDSEITAITTLGDHDLRTDSGNYASQANLLNFLVALNNTGVMLDLKGDGHAIYRSAPSNVSYS